MTIDEANKIVHPVEKEWHYPIMTKYGFIHDTKESTGFVRNYLYHHQTTNHKIRVCTGANRDYFIDLEKEVHPNYWGDLEPHLKQITGITPSV
jgi:hypothetical protein